MDLVATAVAVVIAGLLLSAALEKARDPALPEATLRGLGVPRRIAPTVARLLILVEGCTAIGVLFAPTSTATHLAVAALAVAFASAGATALRADEPVRCSCLGSGGGYLGWRQVGALAPWLAGVAMLRSTPPALEGARLFALTAVLVLAVRSVSLARALGEARGDRRSAQEMLPWLPSH